MQACNRAGLCAVAHSDGVSVVAIADAPLVAYVHDGPGGVEVNAQAMTWLLTSNWGVVSTTPTLRSELSLQILLANGTGQTLVQALRHNTTAADFKDLAMITGRRYRTCLWFSRRIGTCAAPNRA